MNALEARTKARVARAKADEAWNTWTAWTEAWDAWVEAEFAARVACEIAKATTAAEAARVTELERSE